MRSGVRIPPPRLLKTARSTLTLLALLAAGALVAGVPQASGATVQDLQKALDRLVAAGSPGAFVLLRDDKRTIRVSSGYGDRAAKTPMHAGDRFRVGSITKTFVATLILELSRDRKLSLDDTVEHWLPGVVPNGRAISVRSLLNMTSGLFDYLNDGDTTVAKQLRSGPRNYKWKPLQLVHIATRHKPHFLPGKGWSYCNTCYVLLGLIAERATGRPIAAELRSRVFEPLGLRSTRFETGPRIAGAHTHGYVRLMPKKLTDASFLDPSYGWSAGAVSSTAADVARFYRALLGGRVLPPPLLRAMETTVSMGGGNAYGLGLLAAALPCGTAWGHDGGIPGYRSFALSSKNGRRQVVLFANLDETSMSPKAAQALTSVLIGAYCEVR